MHAKRELTASPFSPCKDQSFTSQPYTESSRLQGGKSAACANIGTPLRISCLGKELENQRLNDVDCATKLSKLTFGRDRRSRRLMCKKELRVPKPRIGRCRLGGVPLARFLNGLLQTQLFLVFRLGIKRRSNLHQPANSGKVVFAQARCGGSRN